MAFRIGLTADFLAQDGTLTYEDISLQPLESADNVGHAFFDRHKPEITPGQHEDFDAVLSLMPRITAATLSSAERLTHIARFWRWLRLRRRRGLHRSRRAPDHRGRGGQLFRRRIGRHLHARPLA